MKSIPETCSVVTLPRPIIGALGGGACALLRGSTPVEAIYVAAFGAILAVLVLTFASRLRRGIEVGAIALTLAALFPVVTELWLSLAVLIGGALLHLLHGGGAERLPLRLRLTSHREARADLPIAHVWRRLVPGQGHPDDYWTGTLVDFDCDPDDEMTLYLRHRAPNGLFREATVSFLDQMRERFARWMIEDETAPTGEHCEIEVRLTPEGDFCTRISSELTYRNLPLGRALDLMLDGCSRDSWRGLARTMTRRPSVQLDTGDREVAMAEV